MQTIDPPPPRPHLSPSSRCYFTLAEYWPPSGSAKLSWVHITAHWPWQKMMLNIYFMNEWMNFYTMVVLMKEPYYFDTKSICSQLCLNNVNVLLNHFCSSLYRMIQIQLADYKFCFPVFSATTCSSFNLNITACRLKICESWAFNLISISFLKVSLPLSYTWFNIPVVYLHSICGNFQVHLGIIYTFCVQKGFG